MTATETMNYIVDPRTGLPSTGNCRSNYGDDQEMMDCQSSSQEDAEEAEAHRAAASDGYQRPEPERGVKKTASLRRGGAVYDQLLQSAVMASIESRKDGEGEGIMDYDDDVTSFPPSSPGSCGGTRMQTYYNDEKRGTSNTEISMTSPGKKKRTGHHLSDFQSPAEFGSPPRSKSQKHPFPSAGVVMQVPAPFHTSPNQYQR